MKWFQNQTACDRVGALLDRYEAGDLSQRLNGEVNDHLRGCVPCRRELEALRRVVILVEQLDRSLPPRDLWNGVLAAVQPRPQGARPLEVVRPSSFGGDRARQRGIWGLSGAAAIAAVVGAAFWPHGGSPPDQMAAMAMVPTPAHTVSASFLSQADEASLFDPLADRASLGTMVMVASKEQPAEAMDLGVNYQIHDAIAGDGIVASVTGAGVR
jgi:hypothetical protein